MHIATAYELLAKGEPKPEDNVNLVCPTCSALWSSTKSGVYEMGGPTVEYTNFVGQKNKQFSGLHITYTCPNECTTFAGLPVELNDIHEIGHYTPYDLWQCAKLVVRQHELESELKDVEQELKNYGNLQI